MRTINKAGLDLIRNFEGLRLKAYLCPAGVPTIGYGSTGKDIHLGMTWTTEQADERLVRDLASFEMEVSRAVPVSTDNQFSGLVCFAYNVGIGALEGSTLLKKHNAGDYAGAQAEFGKWNKARVKGVMTALPGLTKRRAAEAALYGAE